MGAKVPSYDLSQWCMVINAALVRFSLIEQCHAARCKATVMVSHSLRPPLLCLGWSCWIVAVAVGRSPAWECREWAGGVICTALSFWSVSCCCLNRRHWSVGRGWPGVGLCLPLVSPLYLLLWLSYNPFLSLSSSFLHFSPYPLSDLEF